MAKGTPKPGEHLFERNGIWYAWTNARIVDPETGKERFRRTKRSTGTASIERAREVLGGWERDLADPTSAKRRGATLKNAFNLLIDNRKALVTAGKKSEASLEFYEMVFRAWYLYAGRRIDRMDPAVPDDDLDDEGKATLRDLGQRMALVDFNDDFVDAFIAHRRLNKRTENTIAKNLIEAKAAMRLARKAGLWVGHVDDTFPERFETGYKPKRVSMTHEQADLLLAEFDHLPHRRAVIAFVLATGAEEAAILRTRRDELTMVPLPLHGTKTDDRERFCFVTLPWQRRLLKFAKAGMDGEGDLAFSEWLNSSRDLADACTRVKVPKVSLHGLRHVFTGWVLDDGINPVEAVKSLGHRDLRQLMRTYDNRDPDSMQRRAEEQAAERQRARRRLRLIRGGKVPGRSKTTGQQGPIKLSR